METVVTANLILSSPYWMKEPQNTIRKKPQALPQQGEKEELCCPLLAKVNSILNM